MRVNRIKLALQTIEQLNHEGNSTLAANLCESWRESDGCRRGRDSWSKLRARFLSPMSTCVPTPDFLLCTSVRHTQNNECVRTLRGKRPRTNAEETETYAVENA